MKTKNILFSLFVGTVLTLGSTGCDDGFDSINENPNEILDNKHPFYIPDIAQAIQYGADYNYSKKSDGKAAGGADVHQRVKSLGIDAFVQYNIGNAAGSSYTANDGWQSLYWGGHYISYLAKLNSAIAVAEPGGDVNATAIALTWRAHMQSLFSDYFGVTPFPTEPTNGVVPPYMSLKDQYTQIFADLDKAAKLFDINESSIDSEPLYGGDVIQWKKFCNTLRVRLAIKMSEVDAALCSSEIKSALKAEYGGLLASSADDTMSAPYGDWGSINYPYTYYFNWGLAGGKTTMSKTMENILVGIGGQPYNGLKTISGYPVNYPSIVDPRGVALFDPCPPVTKTEENKTVTLIFPPTWQGGLVAQNPEAGDYREKIAEMNKANFSQNFTRSIRVMTYTETCFLLAEAVERGFATAAEAGGTAESWYNKGVEASFIELGLTSADAATYLTSNAKNNYGTSALYTDTSGAGNTKLEKIVTQRYIGLFPDLANNIWNDKRRLNLPAMEIPIYRNTGDGTWPTDNNIQNPRNFIQRTWLPQSEPQINKEYYDEAVQMMGGDGDKASTPLWWATGANYCTAVRP